MKLRKPCPHGWYDPHALPGKRIHTTCPGGVFLPDDTLVIEKVDGEWPQQSVRAVRDSVGRIPLEGARLVLDALSVREAPEVDKNQLEVPFKNDHGAW